MPHNCKGNICCSRKILIESTDVNRRKWFIVRSASLYYTDWQLTPGHASKQLTSSKLMNCAAAQYCFNLACVPDGKTKLIIIITTATCLTRMHWGVCILSADQRFAFQTPRTPETLNCNVMVSRGGGSLSPALIIRSPTTYLFISLRCNSSYVDLCTISVLTKEQSTDSDSFAASVILVSTDAATAYTSERLQTTWFTKPRKIRWNSDWPDRITISVNRVSMCRAYMQRQQNRAVYGST